MQKIALAVLALMSLLQCEPAGAGTRIGVSMARFDDTFLTVLRDAMVAEAKTMTGVSLEVGDARNDVAAQVAQIKAMAAGGAQVIIVTPVDTSATDVISAAAEAAKVPLVYVNRQPINIDALPDGQVFVGGDELQSGTLQTVEVCRLLKGAGKASASIYVLMGDLANQAAVQRTMDIHDVMANGKCEVALTIIDEQAANWSRDQAREVMAGWIAAGKTFDAVIANNDEMALGAIEAMKAAGIDRQKVVVAGVDATRDGLAAMEAGDLDVTVFQDGAAQGRQALAAAVLLAAGGPVDRKTVIPFELVTPAHIGQFIGRN